MGEKIPSDRIDLVIKEIKNCTQYKSFKYNELPIKKNRERNAKDLIIKYLEGSFTKENLLEIFKIVDHSTVGHWFGPLLKGKNLNLIKETYSEENWNNLIRDLYDNRENLFDALNNFLREKKKGGIKGVKQGIPTLFLYLLNPEKNNIWLDSLHRGLYRIKKLKNVDGVSSSPRGSDYERFNTMALELHEHFEPQEIDFFLYLIDEWVRLTDNYFYFNQHELDKPRFGSF